MNRSSISSSRALALMLKFKWIRLSNQIVSSLHSGKGKKAGNDQRTGTVRKNIASPTRALSLILLILIGSANMSYFTIMLFEEKIGKSFQTGIGVKIERDMQSRDDSFKNRPKDVLRSEQFLNVIAFQTALWFITLILISIGYQNKDMARLDSDVEWLLTLPVSIPLIYMSKMIEKTIFSIGWLILTPFYGVLLWYWGYCWSLPIIAIGLTLIINFVAALVQFSIEILLRRFFSVYSMNTVQAVATVLGSGLLGIVGNASLLVLEFYGSLHQSIDTIGSATLFLPTGIGLSLLQGSEKISYWTMGFHLIEIGIVVVAGSRLIGWASNRGLEAVQSSGQGKRNISTEVPAKSFFTGIVGKDLKMLYRDKALLVQLGLPIISSLPLLLLPGLFRSMIANPVTWGSVSFMVGTLSLMTAATSVLIHEGTALWLLYTFPHKLSKIILKKVQFWIVLSTILSLVAFGIGTAYRGSFQKEDLFALVWIIVGLPLFGIICASLGVIGTDSFSIDRKKRLREDLMAILLLFGVLLAGGAHLPGAWGKGCCLVMFLLLAIAWWQKAETHLDYQLDPNVEPPPRIQLADGLTAVVLFIMIQNLLTLLFLLAPFISQTIAVLTSYLFAGSLTIALVLSSFRRVGIKVRESFPLWTKGEARGAIIITLKASAIVILIGIASTYYSTQKSFGMQELPKDDLNLLFLITALPVFVLLIRPLLEEILFRGMVFKGLLDSMGFLPAAALSSMIFAMLQPPAMALPTFCAGIVMAWTYQRSGILFAPVFVHAIFNGTILFMQIVTQWKKI
jgi:ABC-2 type transport system permease protein